MAPRKPRTASPQRRSGSNFIDCKGKPLTTVCSAYAFDEIIIIALEGHHGTFSVSKALLCASSDYFKKALNGNFVEAATRTLKLPGCNAETFRWLLHFIVHKNLPRMEVTDKAQFATLDARLWHRMKNDMVRAWVFADYISMPDFGDEAMDRLLCMIDETYIHVATVELIYEFAPAGSALRKMAVKETVWTEISVGYDRKDMERLAQLPDFLHDFTYTLKGHYDNCWTELDYPHRSPSGWAYEVMDKPQEAI